MSTPSVIYSPRTHKIALDLFPKLIQAGYFIAFHALICVACLLFVGLRNRVTFYK